MTKDNVTELPGVTALPENPMRVAERHPGWCRHDSILVDAHTRTVQCTNPSCGAMLEPFNYLLSNANSISAAWSTHRQVVGQAKEVAERVHALKKEEQRLRAMIKRLQEKTGGVVQVRNREP